jgi:hypothetical protein
MIYRIRYRQTNAARDQELVVEANSPTEAMVKFQHAYHGSQAPGAGQIVTSVRAEEAAQETSW